jgi:hypothetical protein
VDQLNDRFPVLRELADKAPTDPNIKSAIKLGEPLVSLVRGYRRTWYRGA